MVVGCWGDLSYAKRCAYVIRRNINRITLLHTIAFTGEHQWRALGFTRNGSCRSRRKSVIVARSIRRPASSHHGEIISARNGILLERFVQIVSSIDVLCCSSDILMNVDVVLNSAVVVGTDCPIGCADWTRRGWINTSGMALSPFIITSECNRPALAGLLLAHTYHIIDI